MLNAIEIATRINNSGKTYCGKQAKGWMAESGIQRVYFGKDFVTIEESGEIHCNRAGKARALTIGYEAMWLVEEFAGVVANV